ncbi:FabD/lysophospholipase-like protein [Glonium stellatum]|uniref:FabD/lysophospholipase-like protein n=1 Tax=Glonium stellatum TaxID=574774 RepID=A0A8E2ESW7_9PEZI|nr:FabD/lysophospholipase-like protein [Glonium stellatum]
MAQGEAQAVLDIQQRLRLTGGYSSQRVLSIDGGGAKTLSSLIILRKICEVADEQEKLLEGSGQSSHGYTPNAPVPSLYFDNCVGSDTGAVAAVMLGRLQMSSQSAVAAIKDLGKVYGNSLSIHRYRYSSRKLENWAQNLIRDKYPNLDGMDPKDCMMMPADRILRIDQCQTAVLIQHRPKITNATPTSSVDAADMIRTYDVVADRALHKKPYLPRAIGHKDDDVPILKTLLAAVAVPGHFPPVAIKGTPHSGVGSKYNNPTSQAFDEGARLYNMKAGEDRQRYDDKRVGIVVSIGAGKEAPRDFLRPWDVYRRMIFRGKSTDRKLSDPGKVHNDMKGRLQAADIPYFRFDGPDLPKCKYDDWSPQTLAIIKKETNSYLARESVKLDIILLARYLVAYRRGRYITRQEDLFPAPTVQEMDAAGSNPIRNNTWPYAESASTLANHIDPSLLRIGRRSQSDNHLSRNQQVIGQPQELPADYLPSEAL